jgi:predicted enzyme related to lactoylglutathione lyase
MTPSRDPDPSVVQLSLAYSIIYVADLPAMARFYSEVLGLPIAQQNARFVAFGGAAAPLALEAGGPAVGGPRAKDQNPTLFQFAVADIAAAAAALAERGLPIEGEIRRGGFGALAFFRDPEGNRLALLERVSSPHHSGGSTSATG